MYQSMYQVMYQSMYQSIYLSIYQWKYKLSIFFKMQYINLIPSQCIYQSYY